MSCFHKKAQLTAIFLQSSSKVYSVLPFLIFLRLVQPDPSIHCVRALSQMMHTFSLYAVWFFVASVVYAAPNSPLRRRATGEPKKVFAHHIVGNTFPYTQQDWLDDITAAHAAGIDAFALNIGTDSWQASQVASA